MTISADRNYPLGVAMLLASGFFLGTSGLALRSVEAASGWQILFFRSASFVLLVFLVLLIRRKGRVTADFRHLGWDDLLLALCLGLGFVAYVFALLHTTVANALFVFSSAPFFAAWMTIAVSVLGLALMVKGGVSRGHYVGNVIALWIPISYAISVILVRRSSAVDMLPALCLAGVVATGLSAVFAEDLLLTIRDLGIAIYLGVFQLGVGFILLILGARYVVAAQAGILALVETVFASVLVWLAFSETPAGSTLLGGGIIFLAVILHSIVTITRTRSA